MSLKLTVVIDLRPFLRKLLKNIKSTLSSLLRYVAKANRINRRSQGVTPRLQTHDNVAYRSW